MKNQSGLVIFVVMAMFLVPILAAGVSALDCGSTITTDVTLDANMSCSGTGITIGADNIVLDCAGHSITGIGPDIAGYRGIHLPGRTGVTVTNCVVTNFGAGITIESGSYNTLTGNTANSNIWPGIEIISSSSYNTLTSNIAINNGQSGLSIFDSTHNTLENNIADSNKGNNIQLSTGSYNTLNGNVVKNGLSGGISLGVSSDNNLITGNAIYNNAREGIWTDSSFNEFTNNNIHNNNGQGIFLQSHESVSSSDNIISNNTVESNSANGIALGNSDENPTNNVISNNDVNSNGQSGISIGSVSGNTFTGNTVSDNNQFGIDLHLSSGNTILSNMITSNSYGGIRLIESSDNTFTGNTVSSNDGVGIGIQFGFDNTLTSNAFSSNALNGIDLQSSSDNTFTGNTVSDNANIGISIWEDSEGSITHHNTFTGNTVNSNNNGGIQISNSFDNSLFNNLFNNSMNIVYVSSPNLWNTTKTPGTNIIGGSFIGGNAWFTPSGDGYSQTCANTNNDGICDSAYTLATDNVDYLPLTAGVSAVDVAISDCTELQNMQNDLAGNYYLANDIDCSVTSSWNSGAGFVPVGSAATPFTGTFDGQNHVITGLLINMPSTDDVGLFGSIGSGAIIQNVGLVNVNIAGGVRVGGLAGYNLHGTITNCYATGSVTGSHSIGGLVGDNFGNITTSYSTGSVTGSVSGSDWVGGLVGYNNYGWGPGQGGYITNCYATGNVVGNSDVGGLVGMNSGVITNSYSTGSVVGIEDIGGLAGYNYGSVIYSYWDTETSGQPASAGGTGMTTAEMKQQSTYETWDFVNIWAINLNKNKGYPYFLWQIIETAQPVCGNGNVEGTEQCDSTPNCGADCNCAPGYIPDSANPGFCKPTQLCGDGIVQGTEQCDSTPHCKADCNCASGYIPDPANPGFCKEGSSVSLYQITNCAELQGMNNDLTADYVLMNDIDCSDTVNWNSGAGFVPVGSAATPFTGTFDGQEYKITDLFINLPSSDDVGLFGSIGSVAIVRNVGLVNVNIAGAARVGGLTGYNVWGTITNCYATGSVTGNGQVGGLVGNSYGTIANSYSAGSVTGSDWVGGLVGYNAYGWGPGQGGHITDSYSTASVTGSSYAGGLVGMNSGVITNSYSAGSVTSSSYAGGLAGYNYVSVIDSYWDTETSGQSTSAGGTGMTTAEMKQQATFAGWDFADVWAIQEGASYPYFVWQTPPVVFNPCGTTITTDLTLNSDFTCSGNGITIGADGITLDCAGHSIIGSGTDLNDYTGIYLFGRTGVTIKNCVVTKFGGKGIFLSSSSSNIITNNNVNNNMGTGIFLLSSSNNNIINNNANDNTKPGIFLQSGSNYNILTSNTVSKNTNDGISLVDSSSNTLTSNTANNNTQHGIVLGRSNNNILTSNTANNNDWYSVALYESSNNKIYNNIFNNADNADVLDSNPNSWNTTKTPGTNIIGGSFIGGNAWFTPSGEGYSQTCANTNNDSICDSAYTLATNNVDYLPLTAVVSAELCGATITTDITLDSDVSCSGDGITIGADNIVFDCAGHSITETSTDLNYYTGIYLFGNGVTLKNCVINGFELGIYAISGSDNTINNNTVVVPDTGDTGYGIYLQSSFDSTINDNTIVVTGTAPAGYLGCVGIILLGYSERNNITNNDIRAVTNGEGSSQGIRVTGVPGVAGTSVNNNLILNNTITTSGYAGVGFRISAISGNIFTKNTVMSGDANSHEQYIIYSTFSSLNNQFYNNLFNSTNGTFFVGTIYANFWNTTSGGNYWANPSGTGFSQTCADANSDGICDSAYTLATNNVDYLPLKLGVSVVDSDGDGVADDADNCLNVANPDQADIGGEGLGDVCDSCPGDANNTCDPLADESSTIGSAGGTIATENGNAKVVIPQGALDEDTSITLVSNGNNYAVSTAQGEGFILLDYGMFPSGHTFNSPITITLSYEQGTMKECGQLGSQEDELDIYYNDPVSGWTSQGATQDCVNNKLTLQTTHFSEYAVIAPVDNDLDGSPLNWGGIVDCNDNNALIHPGATEVCNGIDDNCDGIVDNGLTAPSQSCTVGVGACLRTGTQAKTCNGASGWSSDWGACSATAGTPTTELCNGIDDDCDGQIDEGCPINLKMDSITLLENAKGIAKSCIGLSKKDKTKCEADNKAIDENNKLIDKVIDSIRNSLKQAYWVDELRLNTKKGKDNGRNVFKYESKAVLQCSDKELGNKNSLSTVCSQVDGNLVGADLQIAQAAVDSAKNTAVQNNANKKCYDAMLKTAGKAMGAEAKKKDKLPAVGIMNLMRAWSFGEKAIVYAKSGKDICSKGNDLKSLDKIDMDAGENVDSTNVENYFDNNMHDDDYWG